VHNSGVNVGEWLLDICNQLSCDVGALGIDFELRVIRGPYKPPILEVVKPVLVAQVSLFTDQSYREQRALLRWGWRKYSCIVEEHKLQELAPLPPTINELIEGQSGVREKFVIIESGSSPLVEALLPDLQEVRWEVHKGDALFAEFCLAAGALCARNHARALRRSEADTLANREFGAGIAQKLCGQRPWENSFCSKNMFVLRGTGTL
jgi:hypothetical protein